MNDLVRIEEKLTMSSQEIAEVTGKQHKDVLRDIRLMLVNIGYTSAQFSADVKDSYGRPQPAYRLPKREALILVSGYDVNLRTKIIDRWEELEKGKEADVSAILSDPIRLRVILLDHVEQNIALKNKVAEQAPKVEALERIATGSMGSMCITDAAKHIQIQPAALFRWLAEHRWIYRRVGSSHWIGYQDKIHDGMIEHKVTTIPAKDEWSKEQVFEQVRITAKGLTKLAVVFSGQPKARRKIGIVGMLHGHAAIAIEQFANDADFVVWDYDSSQDKLAAMNHCDMVFLYVNHCSHTTQYKLDSIKANITKVHGGVTSMKEAVARYLAE